MVLRDLQIMSYTRFTLKTNEAEARERLRAFWAGSSMGRPALAITVKNPVHEPKDWAGPAMDRKTLERTPAWHVFRSQQRLASELWLAEAMPSVDLQVGCNLVLLAVLAGGDYQFDNGGHAWVQPLDDLWQRPLPKFDPDHPLLQDLTQSLDAVARAVDHRGFVNPPVLGVEPMTLLSLLRTPEQLCLDMVENPQQVHAWRDALTDMYCRAYEHFYQVLLAHGYRETSSWLPAMAEGRFEAVQCDFAVMLSPGMFAEFVMPDLRTTTDYVDYSLYHLDGTCQMRFLDQLRTLPKLNGIQWNPEPAAGLRVQWIDAFRAIRQTGKSLLIPWCESVAEAVEITKVLGPDGLMLSLPTFDTVDQAEAAIQAIAAVC